MSHTEQVLERTHAEQGQMVMPFYLICDVSMSMSGDMPALNQALQRLQHAIVTEPVVDDVARVGVLTFADSAQVVVPLSQVSEASLPQLTQQGGTNYGAAFRTLAQTILADRDQLKAQGHRVYRPCAFFLTDGEPLDGGFADTFRDALTYDRATGQGMEAYPIFVPFGFRDAPESVLRQLAYPPEKGKWYLARTSDVSEALAGVLGIIMQTVVSSGRRAASGAKGALQLAEPEPGSNIVAGDSEFI